MSYFLSDIEKEKYLRDGFILRRDQFSDTELVNYRNSLEKTVLKAQSVAGSGKKYFLDKKKFIDIDFLTLQYEPQPNEKYLKVIEPAHSLNSELEELIFDERLTDPIKSILSTDSLSLWTDKLNLKRPMVGSGFGWHQDSPYWIHDNQDVDSLPNVYVCLDKADKENGCFRVIKGSHKKGCLPGTCDNSQLGGFYTDKNHFDLENCIDIEANAGSLIFFNPHIVHGSSPNESTEERRAYIVTYQHKDKPSLKSGKVLNI